MLPRIGLTVLLLLVGLTTGIGLAPRLARFGAGPNARGVPAGVAQPDWGGGRLSFTERPAGRVIDSVRSEYGPDRSRTSSWSDRTTGVAVSRKPDADYALALVLPAPGEPGRSGLFELPSTDRFRKELFPGAGDAESPAPDVPLYPSSTCQMQVGRGTACFVGFYLTPDRPAAVRSYYLRALAQSGWQRVAGGGEYLETFTRPREGRTVVLQLREHDSAATRIGLVAMTSASPDRDERK